MSTEAQAIATIPKMSTSFPLVPARPNRASGSALFVGAIIALGVAAIVALDRVGAPGGLVQALGPLLALGAAGAVGVAARNADLASYLAARREIAPGFGGLAFAAIAAGAGLCLAERETGPTRPWTALAIGTALGALAIGPALRRFGASWPSDLVATRFPVWPVRGAAGLAVFATGALTALAGFQDAVEVVQTLVARDRLAAEALVAAAVALSVAPGGLSGLLWSGAVGGAALFAMTAAGAVVGAGALPDATAPGAPMGGAGLIAATLAAASFFAFEPQAFGSASGGRAAKAGVIGIAILAALAMGAAPALAAGRRLGLSGAAEASLAGGARLAAALALAAAGAHGASRAFGVALAAQPKPFPPLASVRLARMRVAQLLAIALAAIADSWTLITAPAALMAAMAISLGLTAPLLALASVSRAGPVAAGAALIAAFAILVWRLPGAAAALDPAALMGAALLAGAAALAAGGIATLVAPRRGATSAPGRFDPFAGPSG